MGCFIWALLFQLFVDCTLEVDANLDADSDWNLDDDSNFVDGDVVANLPSL